VDDINVLRQRAAFKGGESRPGALVEWYPEAERLDPSEITPEALEHLSGVLTAPGRAALVDEAGNRVELPTPLFQHLLRIVRLMGERRAIVMIPEDETFTTQAAANYLGMSRQHLVNLLEEDRIPYHKVGSHRRVYFRDLLAFEKDRDAQRRRGLNELARKVDEAGLYDASYTGDDEG
jgi:excisionase family DNA binding protein